MGYHPSSALPSIISGEKGAGKTEPEGPGLVLTWHHNDFGW